jgi:hypothetical protein
MIAFSLFLKQQTVIAMRQAIAFNFCVFIKDSLLCFRNFNRDYLIAIETLNYFTAGRSLKFRIAVGMKRFYRR